jgi:hypothetical protein
MLFSEGTLENGNWRLDTGLQHVTSCSRIPPNISFFPTLDIPLTRVENTDFKRKSFQHHYWTQIFEHLYIWITVAWYGELSCGQLWKYQTHRVALPIRYVVRPPPNTETISLETKRFRSYTPFCFLKHSDAIRSTRTAQYSLVFRYMSIIDFVERKQPEQFTRYMETCTMRRMRQIVEAGGGSTPHDCTKTIIRKAILMTLF